MSAGETLPELAVINPCHWIGISLSELAGVGVIQTY